MRHRIDHPLALELAQDLVVRPADRVREHVEAATVSHPDHDLFGARRGRQLDRLVEHRHHRVEPLDRELLLPDERPAQIALEALDLGEPGEKPVALLGRERKPVGARFDRLAEPDALLVVRDVLDLVGHRPAVGLLETRQRLGERVALHGDAKNAGRNARLQLGGQRRVEVLGLEPGISDRLRPEGIEARGEMPVHAVGLDERHRGSDAPEQLERRLRVGGRRGGGRRRPVPVPLRG